MGNSFSKVDLHVHTPASKCYTGNKTEEGYFNLLDTAVKNNVKVIAITDHNTIAGYEHLINMKENIFNECSIIEKYNIAEEEKKGILFKKSLFEKVFIVLGVEITLNPGIHIIVLCQENEKDDLNELLDEIGYTSDKRGTDSEFTPNLDIKTFLENPKLEGKIVIAPHVDSNKGIWNSLEGMYRATILKSDRINAICCNNSNQLKNIQNIIKTQPEYNRKQPLAYINASDAHCEIDVGAKHSFFEMKEFSFEELKRTFETPEKSISDIEEPGFIEFARSFSESYKSVYLNKIEELPKYICSVLNNRGGCIFLGISAENQFIGIDLTEKNLKAKINSCLEQIYCYPPKNNSITINIKTEKLGNGKIAALVWLRDKGYGLWAFEQKDIYILDDISNIHLATVEETERIIRENILTELQEFNKRNSVKIKDAISKIKQSSNPISKYILTDKIYSKALPIIYYFNIKHVSKTNTNSFDNSKAETINGMPNGNVQFVAPASPRLDDAYLRYSCPVYQLENPEEHKELLSLIGQAIVISSKGGCYLIDREDSYYLDAKDDVLILTPKETLYKDKISIKLVLAWLKSNCLIWLCLQKYGDINIYNPNVFNSLKIPLELCHDDNIDITKLVEEIIYNESMVLNKICSMSSDDINDIATLFTDHNNSIGEMANKIESNIEDKLQLSKEEIEMIIEELSSEKIYLYACNNKQ